MLKVTGLSKKLINIIIIKTNKNNKNKLTENFSLEAITNLNFRTLSNKKVFNCLRQTFIKK